MKLAALSFFLLLLYVHWTGDQEHVVEQPLSMFRDDSRGLFGYALFATLLLTGVLYVAALARSQREAEAAISAIGVLMLLVVAVTPSTNGFHVLCSLWLSDFYLATTRSCSTGLSESCLSCESCLLSST